MAERDDLPRTAKEIRERLGIYRGCAEEDVRLRVLVGSLRYDWTSYREHVLDGQLATLAEQVVILRKRALSVLPHGSGGDAGAGQTLALERAVLLVVRACAALSDYAPAASLLVEVASLAAATSASCADAVCSEPLLLRALPWPQRALLWRAYPPALERAAHGASEQLRARPCLACPRWQEPEVRALCDAAVADGQVAALAVGACRSAHWAHSLAGSGADADAAGVLDLSVALHSALAGGVVPQRTWQSASGADAVGNGAAPAQGEHCPPHALPPHCGLLRLRTAYSEPLGRASEAQQHAPLGRPACDSLQPLLALLALPPSGAALALLSAQLPGALSASSRSTVHSAARGHSSRPCVGAAGPPSSAAAPSPQQTHAAWLALASCPAWHRLALRVIARGASAAPPSPGPADGLASGAGGRPEYAGSARAALALVAWLAHPRADDGPRRAALSAQLADCAAALRRLTESSAATPACATASDDVSNGCAHGSGLHNAADGSARQSLGAQLLALAEHGAQGSATRRGSAVDGAHAVRWRSQLAFAHALAVAADGGGAGALRALISAAVGAQRASTRARLECVRAEGLLLRALREASEDVAAGLLMAAGVTAADRTKPHDELAGALRLEARRCAERVAELAMSASAAGKDEAECKRAAADAADGCELVCQLLWRAQPRTELE